MTQPLAIINASIVTGDAEGTVLEGMSVLVDAAGRIEKVAKASEVTVPRGSRVMDAAGKHLMPGLINAHAHLFSDGKPLPPVLLGGSAGKAVSALMRSPLGAAYLTRQTRNAVSTQLNSGVTTIRSLGDPGYEVVKVAKQIRQGEFLGPRLFAAGPLMAVSGGHGAPQIALVSDDPWAARRNVRVNLRNGVSAIKIAATGGVTDAKTVGEAGRPQMTEEEMAAICDEAHSAGILVAAHAQSAEGIRRALRAGVDTIEHGAALTDELVELFNDNPKSLRGFSALVPTLMAALPLVRLPIETTGISEVNRQNAVMILDEMKQGIQDALEGGIALGMGTDSGLTHVTHYNTWREIDYVIRHGGVSPERALHAATQQNARILGIQDETGSIEPGKSADMILVEGDPLRNVRVLAQPYAVVARGHLIDDPTVRRFPEIDARLDEI